MAARQQQKRGKRAEVREPERRPARRPLPEWAVYTIGSAAALVPCFWHSRIQAGDLGSHIYNAWLAQLVRSGRAPELEIVWQSTNVLFDYLLSGLLAAFGAAAAQRIAVSLAVLVFVWGAFAFVRRVSGTRPTHLLIAIVMLAYGWVFHMGLFNFYISLGLCFWAMTLAWDFRRTGLIAAAPLFALAYVAHGMAPAWALGVLGYKWITEHIAPAMRLRWFGAAAACVVLLSAILNATLRTEWFNLQLPSVGAVDQVAVFGERYWWCAALLAAAWLTAIGMVWHRDGIRKLLGSVTMQVVLLTALGIGIIPNWIAIPGYNHALVFLAQRTSLALGICICAVAAGARPHAAQKIFLAGAALLFFGFLYQDEGALNNLEDRMEALVSRLPAGQRVISNLEAPEVRTNPLTHLIDRVCIGRCYSYGNYEPSSAQFRVRVKGESPLVVGTDMEANRLQGGIYVVKPRDVPLYEVRLNDDGELAVVSLEPGAQVGITAWWGL